MVCLKIILRVFSDYAYNVNDFTIMTDVYRLSSRSHFETLFDDIYNKKQISNENDKLGFYRPQNSVEADILRHIYKPYAGRLMDFEGQDLPIPKFDLTDNSLRFEDVVAKTRQVLEAAIPDVAKTPIDSLIRDSKIASLSNDRSDDFKFAELQDGLYKVKAMENKREDDGERKFTNMLMRAVSKSEEESSEKVVETVFSE